MNSRMSVTATVMNAELNAQRHTSDSPMRRHGPSVNGCGMKPSGFWAASGRVLNDVASASTNGTRKANAAATSTM
jgi:hypothetical protein